MYKFPWWDYHWAPVDAGNSLINMFLMNKILEIRLAASIAETLQNTAREHPMETQRSPQATWSHKATCQSTQWLRLKQSNSHKQLAPTRNLPEHPMALAETKQL